MYYYTHGMANTCLYAQGRDHERRSGRRDACANFCTSKPAHNDCQRRRVCNIAGGCGAWPGVLIWLESTTSPQVHGPGDMDALLAAHPTSLVIVMCKARGCRPCKAFSRKYVSLAEQYPDCVFAEIVGDESSDTRVRVGAHSLSQPAFTLCNLSENDDRVADSQHPNISVFSWQGAARSTQWCVLCVLRASCLHHACASGINEDKFRSSITPHLHDAPAEASLEANDHP